MPRYYFNDFNGKRLCDEEGVVLADDAATRAEAIKLAGRTSTTKGCSRSGP